MHNHNRFLSLLIVCIHVAVLVPSGTQMCVVQYIYKYTVLWTWQRGDSGSSGDGSSIDIGDIGEDSTIYGSRTG